MGGGREVLKLVKLMSAFFAKKIAFFGKNSTFTQSNRVGDLLEIF